MDPQALSALISATAGLLGALLGFAGSQLTHKRNVDLARDQRRFERAQEMRAEVIPKLFVELKNFEEAFAHILDFGPSAIEAMKEVVRRENEGLLNAGQRDSQFRELFAPWQKRNQEAAEKLDELKEYFRLHRIWLPQDLGVAMGEVMQGYSEHWGKAFRAIDDWAEHAPESTPAPEDSDAVWNQSREYFEEQIRETRVWFEGERREREESMWSIARKTLAVEE